MHVTYVLEVSRRTFESTNSCILTGCAPQVELCCCDVYYCNYSTYTHHVSVFSSNGQTLLTAVEYVGIWGQVLTRPPHGGDAVKLRTKTVSIKLKLISESSVVLIYSRRLGNMSLLPNHALSNIDFYFSGKCLTPLIRVQSQPIPLRHPGVQRKTSRYKINAAPLILLHVLLKFVW